MLYFIIFLIVYIISIPFALIYAVKYDLNKEDYWVVYIPPFCIIIMIYIIIHCIFTIIINKF